MNSDERAPTAFATLTVFLVMVGHALLETSRDALFIANVPATHLPWVYLTVALVAVLASRLVEGIGGRAVWRGLFLTQIAAALGTLAFVLWMRHPARWMFYALYLWGGLAAMLILIRFWLLLSERLTVAQAKRLYPMIAAGPVLGMLAGFALAGSRLLSPSALLAVSCLFFSLSAIVAFTLRQAFCRPPVHEAAITSPAPSRSSATRQPIVSGVAAISRDPYVRRVTLVLLAASVTATLADYAFKTGVARAVGPHDLSTFFARSYFLFNALSLVVLAVVMPFVRLVGVPAALAVQPALLGVGALLWMATGGLSTVLILRGADVALRWSLHKTATELLYVPMSARLRRTVKAISDIVTHRGGQAVASIIILTLLAVRAPEWALGGAMVLCSAVWIYAAASLRQPYLELFRNTLRSQFVETRLDFPELDLASLETLITALSSSDDHEVVAAMELLSDSGRVRLIPVLILYHPSAAVVVRALELFQAAGREDFLPITQRLLGHADPAVRAAVIRAHAAARPDRAVLERAYESPHAEVRITARVVLIAKQWTETASAVAELTRNVGEDAGLGVYVALAACTQPAPELRPLLTSLVQSDDMVTRREAIRAMGAIGDVPAIEVIVGSLGDRAVREDARATLLALGDPAFAALQRALQDFTLPPLVRLHLPRTISRFADQRAADLLLGHLLNEPRGMVRYKILRGLGRMVETSPQLHLDEDVLDRVIDGHVSHLFEMLHWLVTLQEGAQTEATRQTTGHEMLVQLLRSKYSLALERLFRVLGLRYRKEDVGQIYRGLVSDDDGVRASSRELIETVLPIRIRAALVALTDSVPDAVRLLAGAPYYTPSAIEYMPLIAKLAAQQSESVSYLASFHARELGLGLSETEENGAPPAPVERERDAATRLFASATGLA